MRLTTIRSFLKNEDGAVTVDWVVLTAAIVGLSVAGVASITNGINTVGTNVESALANTTVDNGNTP
ncbi:hypothetical protein AAFO92_12815 [Roseovarius sp. CAU 1744]|uniref:Flp family type IVb pilin n=1 Tax=Roseovarius sp. CAU 1744 TaxID=3140368 RepID=UPI00325A64CA